MARLNRLRNSPGRKSGFVKKFTLLLLAILIIGTGAVAFILFETESPTIDPGVTIEFLGSNLELPITVSDSKSGIRSVVIELDQDGQPMQLFNRFFQRKAWLQKGGPAKSSENVEINAKKAGAKDGKAELVIRVRDFSLAGFFKGNETVLRVPVTIDTEAPKVTISHGQRYIRPGGSGIVIYTVSEEAPRHGVVIDDLFYPGFPLGSKGKNYIAYIGLPWDKKQAETTKVIAFDAAGNAGKAVFNPTFKKKRFKKDTINISDGFLKRKIPEFQEHYPDMTGSLIEKYLYANQQVRLMNAEAIKKICENSVPEQLWQDRFLRMPGAGKAGFADQRDYYYKGQVVDHQIHLGMDIASTERVAIKAANRGKVIFADYMGIYGNMVILDHGQGLFSLYSHLSRIDISKDTIVDKDTVIAHSGATGMAGGDHLHFSMLVHGIFVTPVEWWDQHWIDVNIKNLIGDTQL